MTPVELARELLVQLKTKVKDAHKDWNVKWILRIINGQA